MTLSIILILAFIIDLILGDPHYSWHPICLIGRLISKTEKELRRHFPADKRGERLGGLLLVIITVAISVVIPALLLRLAYGLHVLAGLALELLFCYQLLAAGSLKAESMKVCHALKKGDIEGARYAVSMIVGRDTSVLDEAGITRAAVETVAENASDGVLAPMIYMAIGGPLAGFFYKAVNTMDSMVGYKNDKYRYFGTAAARMDDVLNFIPSRISGLLIIAAARLTGMDYAHGWRIFLRDRKKHASPNSAQTEAACAGCLHLRLAGDAWYFGELHKKPYIGDDDRAIEAEDIERANQLMITAAGLCLAICVCLRLLIALAITAISMKGGV